ncbi:hypothetical protein U9M48_006851 [Paspalum notatum var. saurae]|uniref:Uncharacterized protein n=1 Tax=Paspalum notatum var. saurae TaxID=547442 RepID=A0AAQ3PZI5_PASNO
MEGAGGNSFIQSRSRAVNTHIALATTQKGNQSITDYVAKMKYLADEMACAGKPLENEELVQYVPTGLDMDYNPVVTSILARTQETSFTEVVSQLLSFEQHIAMYDVGSQSSANVANRGNRGGRGHSRGRAPPGRGGRDGGRGRGGYNNNNPRHNYNNRNTNNHQRPCCQVCHKEGHTADRCWHRFEEDYVPDERHYTSNDQIHRASGVGMHISHVGHSVLHTPDRSLCLNNILHVPRAANNLVSVHHFTSDNNAYLEFHPNFFLVKDEETKKTILRGRCQGEPRPHLAARPPDPAGRLPRRLDSAR